MNTADVTVSIASPPRVASPCSYCGPSVYHPGACPRVKAFEFHANGTLKRVEFHDLRRTPQ